MLRPATLLDFSDISPSNAAGTREFPAHWRDPMSKLISLSFIRGIFSIRAIFLQVCGLAVLVCGVSGSLHAQAQASCTFTYFDPPSGYGYGFYPSGINHYNTVVG